MSVKTPAALSLVAQIVAPVLAGCTGDVGVHLVVTMPEDRWSITAPLDHIRIEASSASHTAAACLYPQTEVTQATEDSSLDPHACADGRQCDINLNLDYQDWGLAEGRRVNFVFPNTEPVSFRVTGGFGGSLDLSTAEGSIAPESDFAELSVELSEPAGTVFGMQCPISLDEVTDKGTHTCDSASVSCLLPLGAASGGAGAHTAAMSTIDERFCRVRNRADAHECQTESQGLYTGYVTLFELNTNMPPPTQRMRLKGRFARCADGGDPNADCTLTSDCTPPATRMVAVKRLGAGSFASVDPRNELSLDCLPPTSVAVEFGIHLRLSAPEKDAVYAVLLAQQPAEDVDDPCFFDLVNAETVTGG